MSEFNGLLLVDKPQGWTSFDVVAKVRGLLQAEIRRRHTEIGTCMGSQSGEVASSTGECTDNDLASKALRESDSAIVHKCRCKLRVGHTGTLDPMATGLLVLCIGSFTKKVPELIKHDKEYVAEMTLGATSHTGDAEGEIVQSSEFLVPSMSKVQGVLANFVGEQLQTPPAFSALKIGGKKAYELARAGKEVKLEPRVVTIYELELLGYTWPKLEIRCKVSSGTYIRVLAEDIGRNLGTGAYLSVLRRTKVDTYRVADALAITTATTADQVKSSLRMS